jgi:microcystin-dependent protein
MNEPLIGEIRLFAFAEPPAGWLRCDGQLLTRTQYAELFGVLGTLYGGDEHATFALPNLQGRVAVHPGGSIQLSQRGGEEAHSLTLAELPNHTHLLSANAVATTGTAQQHFWGPLVGAYSTTPDQPDAALGAQALAPVGDSEPHSNLQPYLVANYCIAALAYRQSPRPMSSGKPMASSARCDCSRAASHRAVGRPAMASCFRHAITRICTPSSAPCMGATARARSRCPICAGVRPCTKGTGRACRRARSARAAATPT